MEEKDSITPGPAEADVPATTEPEAPSGVPDTQVAGQPEPGTPEEELSAELFIHETEPQQETDDARWLAVLEAIVYVTDEPLTVEQIARAIEMPLPEVKRLLDRLVEEFNKLEHGLTVKEVAGGYKMATKPEHHEAVRTFVKKLNPPLKLSLAALETLAVIAYKQPITAPEIMEIRGVQGAGVLKTLLDRKLITTAGRKNVVGKPILYKTTKEFLVQFGLKDLLELPTLKEFEDLRRMAMHDDEEAIHEADTLDGQAEEAALEAEPEAAPEEESEPEPKVADE
jgi:segregation and condensation protein B